MHTHMLPLKETGAFCNSGSSAGGGLPHSKDISETCPIFHIFLGNGGHGPDV